MVEAGTSFRGVSRQRTDVSHGKQAQVGRDLSPKPLERLRSDIQDLGCGLDFRDLRAAMDTESSRGTAF